MKRKMKNKKKYQICVIGGDGIGPEVVNEGLLLLQSLPIDFEFTSAEMGFRAYQKYQTPLPQETLKKCRQADAILFGAVTTPPNIETPRTYVHEVFEFASSELKSTEAIKSAPHPRTDVRGISRRRIKNYFSPIVRLRRTLDLYANVRPSSSLPVETIRQGIDLIIVRENTEGIYIGEEEITKKGAVTKRVITKKGCQRIIRFAFELAVKQKRQKVTAVHKANVMRLTDGLFLKTAQKIAKKYPKIIFEDMLVDSCAMRLIKNPQDIDVIVTTNMFGDILSDEASALVGGLGVAASANLGEKYALFEPVHGSAPKYEGKNRANPTACFLAIALMLEYLGEDKEGKKVRNSVLKTISKGITTPDLGGKALMTQVTKEVIKNYQKQK